MLHGLSDLRVIDFSDNIAGSYATKLMADAGAEVIKVEPPAGDPMRRWYEGGDQPEPAGATTDAALFQFLNTSKKSITGHIDEPVIAELIGAADLVVNTFAPNAFTAESLCKQHPHLVVLSITPYGRTGPYAGRPSTEFILQAESGSLSGRGLLGQMPFQAGGRITEWVGGTYAAVAAIAACRRSQQLGTGDHLDFSLLEVMNIAGTTYANLSFSLAGWPVMKYPVRSVEIPSIEPTADGWVGFNTNSFQQYSDFLVLIGRTDLLQDKELATIHGRSARMEEWNTIVRDWTRKKSTAEIVETAALFRIPVAPVCNGKTVLEQEHFKARGVFVKNPSGGFLQPRPPYRINTELPTPLGAAPAIGEHNNKIEPRKSARVAATSASPGLPLAGIRVLDATAWWAGPSATQMLAFLGAEVIHLEAIQRPDGMRMMGGRFMDKPRWWEYSAMFLGANTNKLGLTLDLDNPAGLQTMKKLIAKCDMFVENYSPRVMEKFGLDWEAVHAISPGTIMVRMPAFGLDGPWRDHVGFAQTMEQMTGMAWITGFADDQPRIQRGPCDPLAGMHAAFASLVALGERDKTGLGSFVECPMVEGALNASAEQIIRYSAHGQVMERDGNRCESASPQGLYPCQGHTPEAEQWLALSVETDAQWQGLLQCLEHPAELENPVWSDLDGRRRHADEIDTVLEKLFANLKLEDILAQLLVKQVPAGEVWPVEHAHQHPQLSARDFFSQVEHPVVGRHPHPTTPFMSQHTRQWVRCHAPTIGQHNERILQETLGLDEEQIRELERTQVTGSHPLDID